MYPKISYKEEVQEHFQNDFHPIKNFRKTVLAKKWLDRRRNG